MTQAPPRDCALHLRVLDTDVAVEFAGAGGAELMTTAAQAWSRCLIDPEQMSEEPVRRRVVMETEQDRNEPPEAEQRAPASVDDAPQPTEAEQARDEPSTKPLDLPTHHILTGTDPLQLMDRLSPMVTLAAIEQQAGRLLMLHAAAIADPATGRAIAFVGPSGAGKTTATRVLAQRWGYITDETVGIREDHSLAIYPKPLSIKVDTSQYKEQRPLDELGLAPTPTVADLHRVILLARDGSAAPWLEQVSTVRALALLAPETSYLSRLERPLHRLAEMLGPPGLRRLHYRDAEQLPDLVEQLLEED